VHYRTPPSTTAHHRTPPQYPYTTIHHHTPAHTTTAHHRTLSRFQLQDFKQPQNSICACPSIPTVKGSRKVCSCVVVYSGVWWNVGVCPAQNDDRSLQQVQPTSNDGSL
jgi:hypothetical protein